MYRRQLPAWLHKPARACYHRLYRAFLPVRCWCSDHIAAPRKLSAQWPGVGPVPPAIQRFRVGETTDVSVYLDVGKRTADRLAASLSDAGRSLEDCRTVLDFGCGCARTLRWLIPGYPGVRFSGADTDGEAIRWCREHLREADFHVNGAVPPMDYADESFDFVYAVSVFTHLSAEHQRLWIGELHRILRPAGLLLVTVHGENLAPSLPPEALKQLQQDGFRFETSDKLRGILPDWYHTAFHTERFVRDLLAPGFRVLSYQAGGFGYQDVIVGERN